MMKKAYARGGMQKKGYAAGGASMKKKMMAAGGTMKKKMMAAGGTMKKKGYAVGGLKEPSANQVGLKKLPTPVRNKMGYMKEGGAAMYKKGYAAGGAAMKKKMMAGGGATSSYDTADRKYPGAGKKRTGTTTKAKKPVVTKAMMTKAGVTSLRDFYNKMEVNAAGTGYKKRSKALTRKDGSSSRSRKTVLGSSKNVSTGTGKGTTTMKANRKKKAGPMGFPSFFAALDKRIGFK